MDWRRWLRTGYFPDDQMAPDVLRRKLERGRAARTAAGGAKVRQDQRVEELERELLQLQACFAAVVRLLHDKGIVEIPELERAIAAQVTGLEKRLAEQDAEAAAAEKKRRLEAARRVARRRRQQE